MRGHLYTHPYPVGERQFLVSCKVDPAAHYKEVANAYALCLIDTEGQRRRDRADAELSCWHPCRWSRGGSRRGCNSPSIGNLPPPTRLCAVANVYQGMEGIEPGEVKWLRINEALPRYWSTGRRWNPSLSSSSWNAALWPRVQWGVVPVEKDGSAQFVVPANRSIFFQALDGNFREIQRERTYVNYSPGEVRSCGGCHGQANRAVTPGGSPTPLALTRPPSTPQPQPCDLVENGGDGRPGQVIHYPADIQPIFDAKCTKCHGGEEPAAGLN